MRPAEHRASFLKMVYGCIERTPLFPREGRYPFPKLRGCAHFVSHAYIMRWNSYDVTLMLSVAAASKDQGVVR